MTPIGASYSVVVVQKPYRGSHVESSLYRIKLIGCPGQSEAVWGGAARDKGSEETTAFGALGYGFDGTSQGIQERDASAMPCFGALDIVVEYVVFDVASDAVKRYRSHCPVL